MKIEKILKTIQCDECNKDINETDIDHYYEVHTSHSCWGNDSIDSHEDLDFCCWKCLTNNLGKYFADADNSYRYEIERVDK